MQSLIADWSRPTKDPKHDTADVRSWIWLLAKDVVTSFPKRGKFDENMRAAAVLSLILATWFLRVKRAKCWDPRRPIRLRKQAYQQWLQYAQALALAVADERIDPVVFAGQKWDSPFAPGAKDGTFI